MATGMTALLLCLGPVTNASAGSISGNYAYTFQNATGGCGSYGLLNYSATGTNTYSATDALTFSTCAEVGVLIGPFTIGTGGNSISGTVNGVFTGYTNGGNSAIFDGTFSFNLPGTGTYSGVTDGGGIFEVIASDIDPNSGVSLDGTFDFQSTPEPVTTVLGGSGILLLMVSRKLRKQRV